VALGVAATGVAAVGVVAGVALFRAIPMAVMIEKNPVTLSPASKIRLAAPGRRRALVGWLAVAVASEASRGGADPRRAWSRRMRSASSSAVGSVEGVVGSVIVSARPRAVVGLVSARP
jgi:hypothetical protein